MVTACSLDNLLVNPLLVNTWSHSIHITHILLPSSRITLMSWGKKTKMIIQPDGENVSNVLAD